MECKSGRRESDCFNMDLISQMDEDLKTVNRTLASSIGQVKLFKWMLGTMMTIILVLGGYLYARTNDLNQALNVKTTQMQMDNAKIKEELKDMIQEIRLELKTIKVIETKLDTIEKNLDDLTSVAAYNQNLIKGIKR